MEKTKFRLNKLTTKKVKNILCRFKFVGIKLYKNGTAYLNVS